MNAYLYTPTGLDEPERLRALARYDILDTPRERDFDDIAELASEICAAPIAIVNFVTADRQFFKAEVGLGIRETPLDKSFCGHAILLEDFMLVPDATKDVRFNGNPLVTRENGLRFYAGALLKTEDGQSIGTICVLDTVPRTLTKKQIESLRRLARQVMAQLEMRRLLRAKRDLNDELEIRVAELTTERDRSAMMGREIDHRVMNSLQFISTLLAMQSRAATISEVSAQLDAAAQRVATAACVHRHFYIDETIQTICALKYSLRLAADLQSMIGPAKISVDGAPTPIATTLVMPLGLIMNELVTNASKHGGTKISLCITAEGSGVRFTVADDGPGLPDGFDPSARKGLGMTVVNALLQQTNGTMNFETSSKGTIFSIRIG